jgi:aspartate/methionine/tyrosine aminotransferase
MFPAPFALERFFAQHEFSARHLLSTSDCQGLAMADLLAGAEDDLRARWDDLHLGYTESQGLPDLREEIATLYEGVKAGEILVAAPEEAIFLAMNALLEPGDHVVCTFPGYQSLYALARSIGCDVDLWQPLEAEGWRFDPAELEELLRPDTKLVVWNFPHNPTGALPTCEDYARMIEAVTAVGAWTFSDEMYRLLEPSPEARLPAAADAYERAVSLSGMSKAFGLAGLRIGWVATHGERVLERMKTLKDYTTICSSAPGEMLALMGLRSRDAILAHNRERLNRNREAADAFFTRHAHSMTWVPPRAGTVCFPRLVDGDRRGAEGAEAFCGRVLSETGILLLPSTVYGYGDSHFRLGLGRDEFVSGLEALDAFLETDAQAL